MSSDDPSLERKSYTYQSGAVYTGQFKGAKRHGIGHWQHPDGEVYEGQYDDNRQSGKGVYVFGKTGKMYVGDWDRGMLHGHGVYYFNSAKTAYYVGKYESDKKNGDGYYMYENNVLTSQSWKGGELIQEREATAAERVDCARQVDDVERSVRPFAPQLLGPLPTTLEMKNFQFPSGATYCGQFSGTKKYGQGYWAHPEGDTYEGSFENNRHHGWGVYTSGKSGKKYAGQWKSGLMHGWGVYFFTPQETEFFVGQYVEDKKHGIGLYHYAESGQSKEQLWAAGELVKETDADEKTVQDYIDAIKAIIKAVHPVAPRYHSDAFST
jgi:hypothetical protein